jgi:uncharacterized protein (TIGR00266 family)
MSVLELSNETILVQSGAFVASALSVEINTSWGGAKGFFGSGGLILLKASGSGSLILSSYGAIHEMTLAANQKFTIDTGHIVAFSESIGFKVRQVGGLKSTLLSGEGLVVDLTGPGRLLMQTRSTNAFLSWLIPLLPKSKD